MPRFVFLTLLLLCYTLQAQDMSKVHFVRASGEATIKAKPDRAQISIGVTTRGATAQAAAAQNASETAQVLQAVKGALGKSGDVKTTGYSIAPQYDYSNGHAPKLTGYETNNTVLVTEDDLSALGNIIDAATGSGATNINGIAFMLRDDTAVREKALEEAALRAKANAETIARALNVRVVGLLQAEPNEMPAVQPRPMAMMAARVPPATTPIESGDLDIHANVSVVLEVQ